MDMLDQLINGKIIFLCQMDIKQEQIQLMLGIILF